MYKTESAGAQPRDSLQNEAVARFLSTIHLTTSLIGFAGSGGSVRVNVNETHGRRDQ